MSGASNSLRSILEHVTLPNTCKAGTFVLGAHMMQVGLWAFISPSGLCKAFGMRFDGRPFNSAKPILDVEEKDSGRAENFWPMLFAPRELGFGMLVCYFGSVGQWKTAGLLVATVAGLLATTDGVAAGLFGKDGWNGAIASHFVPGVVLGGMSSVLLSL